MVYVRAEAIYEQAQYQPCVLNQIQFENVSRTKKSALMKETMELYRSRTLDELIRKTHIAATHMQVSGFKIISLFAKLFQEVGLVERCVPFVEKCAKTKNSFNLRFVLKEPKPLFVGVKMGVTSSGSADCNVTAAKQVKLKIVL